MTTRATPVAPAPGGLVCLQAELDDLPPLPPEPGTRVLEMDPHDPAQVERYLSVHNGAFEVPWGVADYERELLRNPAKRITTTFLMMDGDEVVAAASIGVFRENPEMGVGHFLTVRREHQRRGFGRWLVLYRFHRLRREGLRRVEMETRLRYVGSILLHFGCGFRPKLDHDRWNTPRTETPEITLATRQALRDLYSEWLAGRADVR